MSNAAIHGNTLNSGATSKLAKRTINGAANVANSFNVLGGLYRETLALTDKTIQGVGIVVIEATAPAQTFHNSVRNFTFRNLILKDFRTPIVYNNTNQNRIVLLQDFGCTIAAYNVANVMTFTGNRTEIWPEQLQRVWTRNYNWVLNCSIAENITVVGGEYLNWNSNSNALNSTLRDSIITNTAITFQSKCLVRRCLFSTACTFTYSDGVNSVSAVSFAAFAAANTTHDWGFDLTGCDTEDPANTFIDGGSGNFYLKPTSKAATMSATGGPIGCFPIGTQLLATDSGWTNNVGFSLVSNKYQASDDAQIESPIIDLGANRLIRNIEGDFTDAFLNGLLFNAVGNLGTAIYTGGSASGLSIALTAGEGYTYDNVLEVITNQRTLAFSTQTTVVAQSGEIITDITASGTATVRPVVDYSGMYTIYAKFWKDGEGEPLAYKKVFRRATILIDSNGYTNAESNYNPALFPRNPVARYSRFLIVITKNNTKS